MSAPAPSPAPPVPAEPRFDARVDPRIAGQVEAAADQLAGTREGQRNLRPEVTLRHGEFGLVNMRLEASGEDLRATLSARDPGFVPAVRHALAERGAASASDWATQAGLAPTQRISEPGGSSGVGMPGGGAQAQAGGSGAGQGSGQQQGQQHGQGQQQGQPGPYEEPRYGSSPGSGQGSPQPYLAHTEGEGRDAPPQGDDASKTRPASRSASGPVPGTASTGRDRGVYA
ncbi:MAG: hypothetical protein RIB52_08925 [Erythrobacter sp.]|uniref:hypothetical protein n=1 Tax=Erythrobacter sp. TaxID=1042 RepID=UPI0032EF38A0